MARSFAAMRDGTALAPAPRPISVSPIPPALVVRGEDPPATEPLRRTKIWEFNTNLHCSIIGTCLSTGELRQVMKKLGVAAPDSSDHELHGAAVSLAGRHDKAAKLLHKALDERHRVTINQFSKVTTEEAVRALWREARQRGEIPGAYWAALTHPATTQAIIREAFGDVHMLSHLVGAANRADIRRLCQLEAENAELRARLDRQQVALRDAVVTRDASIQHLRHALAQRIAAESPAPGEGEEGAVLRPLVADLERRLGRESRRNDALAEKLAAAQAMLAEERAARVAAERDADALRLALGAAEAAGAAAPGRAAAGAAQEGGETACLAAAPRLDGVTVLYVGGRPNQVAHLRAAAEQWGAAFLHHDGGVEHHLNLLAGLASQASLVVFPVDCISHHAANLAKQLCRQMGKRFIPLRSSGTTCMLAALRRPDVAELADAAD